MEQTKGKVFIFSAPSGAGKTTIVKHVLDRYTNFEFSVSATTRPPRPNEQEGVHYYFLNTNDFVQRIEQHEFLEWEEVYPGQFYGSLKSDVERIRKKRHHVAFDVDVKGGIKIKKFYGEEAVSIFIKPPDLETLRRRLKDRGTETYEEIEKRYAKAVFELEHADEFDYIILNDNLETALAEVFQLIHQHLTKVT